MSRSAFATDDRGLRVLQDPSDVLDYQFNWATWLGVDTIASSTWSVGAGLTKGTTSNTTTTATVWLSGGSVGVSYFVTNTVVTAGGRTASRSFFVDVLER